MSVLIRSIPFVQLTSLAVAIHDPSAQRQHVWQKRNLAKRVCNVRNAGLILLMEQSRTKSARWLYKQMLSSSSKEAKAMMRFLRARLLQLSGSRVLKAHESLGAYECYHDPLGHLLVVYLVCISMLIPTITHSCYHFDPLDRRPRTYSRAVGFRCLVCCRRLVCCQRCQCSHLPSP